MEILKDILLITEYIVFIYLAFNSLYIFTFGIAGLFRYKQKKIPGAEFRKIAVLVPGYREDNVIVDTARQSLMQNYPKEFFDVYIIADSFHPETIRNLASLDVHVMEVKFDVSSKARALNEAMRRIEKSYSIVVILDADNVMSPDFLSMINGAFENGYTIVQGHRIAKNTNTPFAVLDAISEEINNHIFRKGHRVLGLSSALIGSGMAFPYDFYRDYMSDVTSHGEDKELEIKLLKNGITISYLHEALVWDEKVQKAEVFAKQRRRWLSAQIGTFRQYIGTAFVQLITRGNIDLFDKLLQMILAPRIIHAGTVTFFLFLFTLLQLLTPAGEWIFLPLEGWITLWIMTVSALLFSVPRKFYNRETLRALKALPRAFFIMFSLLFKLKGAGKTFIHTEHGISDKK